MSLRSTPEIDVTKVVVQFPGEKEFYFFVNFTPNTEENANPSLPNLRLYVAEFRRIIKPRLDSFEENTKFVRYLIDGFVQINRKWPLYRTKLRLGSDLNHYKQKNIPITEFDFPSDDELARL